MKLPQSRQHCDVGSQCWSTWKTRQLERGVSTPLGHCLRVRMIFTRPLTSKLQPRRSEAF